MKETGSILIRLRGNQTVGQVTESPKPSADPMSRQDEREAELFVPLKHVPRVCKLTGTVSTL